MEIVAVLWVDSAHIHFGWSPVADLECDDPTYCLSVGMLIEDTPDHVLIVQSSDLNGQVVSNSLKIPKVSILDVKKLTKSEKIKWKRHK